MDDFLKCSNNHLILKRFTLHVGHGNKEQLVEKCYDLLRQWKNTLIGRPLDKKRVNFYVKLIFLLSFEKTSNFFHICNHFFQDYIR